MMFVGEAPGEDDEIANSPLSGSTGEIFERLLISAGIQRNQIFSTNLTKCRPLDESVIRRDRNGRVHYGTRIPFPQEAYTCGLEHLEPEILSQSPKVLVPMGSTACEYIFGKYAVGADGKIVLNDKSKPKVVRRLPKMSDLMWGEYWDKKRNCWIIPMMHPAQLAATPEWFILMGELVKKARKVAEHGPGMEKTQVSIATNYDDAMALIRQATQAKIIAYDHETDGLDWRFGPLLNVGLSWQVGFGASIRFVDNKGIYLYSPAQRQEIINAMIPIFQSNEKVLAGYNVPFDASWTEKALGLKVTTPQHDVQSIYHTLNSTATYKRQNLEMLTWLYTDMANYKQETDPWFSKKKFLECPIPVMSARNGADCDSTLRLFNRFYPKLEASPAKKHYDRLINGLVKASTTLHVNGVNIDLPRLQEMAKIGEQESDRLAHEFFATVGVEPFNIRSPIKLRNLLFDKMGLPILERTATGLASTNEYTLTELAKQSPALAPLMEYKKLQKLMGTYIYGMRGSVLFGNSKKRKPDVWTVEEAKKAGYNTDGRAHPSFAITGTVTGRPSVSKPNVANQPRPTDQQKRLGLVTRQSFGTNPGWWILERDLSQAELRVLAAVSGDKALKEAVNSPEGVHRRTAAFFYKIEVANVSSEQKSSSKTVVFAITYGGSEYTVEEAIPEVLDAELIRRFTSSCDKTGAELDEALSKYAPTKDERLALAKEWINAWKAQYPRAGQWIDSIKSFVKSNGYIISPFGRVFHFPLAFSSDFRIRNECERQAVNYVIQSTASDITFMAGLRIQNEIEKRGYRSVWENMVYDSLAFEVPNEELEAMKELTRQEMERPVPELDIEIVSDLEIGHCWKDSDKYEEESDEEEVEENEEVLSV